MADLLHTFFAPFRLMCDISAKQVAIVMKMVLF